MGVVLVIFAIVLLAMTGGSAVDVATVHDHQAAVVKSADRAVADQPVAESIGQPASVPEQLAAHSAPPAADESAEEGFSVPGSPCVKADGTMYPDCASMTRRPSGYVAPAIRLASEWVRFGAR